MLTVILAKRANLLCLDIYKFLFEEENSGQLWTEGFTTYQQNMSMTQKKKTVHSQTFCLQCHILKFTSM